MQPNKGFFYKISNLSIYLGNVFDGISAVIKMSHADDYVMMRTYRVTNVKTAFRLVCVCVCAHMSVLEYVLVCVYESGH